MAWFQQSKSGTGSAVDHGASGPRRLLSRNLQPTRRTAKGIDGGADQRNRSQIWTRIQAGGVRDLPIGTTRKPRDVRFRGAIGGIADLKRRPPIYEYTPYSLSWRLAHHARRIA